MKAFFPKKIITMNFQYVIIFLVSFGFCFLVSCAEFPYFNQSLKDDGSLSFLVIGDWGRKGLYNQSELAFQMGEIGEKLKIDFVISSGDNFYEDGLNGVNDPTFQHSFTNIYKAPSLQKTWYNEIVDFFFIDTTPFVDDYFTNPKEHTYDWRGVLPKDKYLNDLLKDLDLALSKSTAKWKMVIGHHTIKSAGHHGIITELAQQLVPILEEHDVDFYINGHDHCLQRIGSIDSKLEFLTSGGGSKAWRGDVKGWNPTELKFYYDGQGFISIKLNQKEVEFVYYDVFGNVLHKFSVSKDSCVSSQ
ncbi:purple acid phosphatase 8-like isoform X2 [Solanum verrucosum]|uniref:purple acid phosphatase 8-like isoform X2 n=1 Tax=Solanum verrucosum TaxID=315347 RepID=UPI0020D0061B|nr:purple acid phosphatase 8-like isoform X2 [Solanum verrucosum]